ncbi:MAG TPA: SUMF1/EgtB/PvdO family nonheme iron enzyme [Tepidisphaeraceae bacterium]|nr:SUMF1/EgtB/PvdO family nonheme iron enzyme [Tepidisphaeraceae bacterium]
MGQSLLDERGGATGPLVIALLSIVLSIGCAQAQRSSSPSSDVKRNHASTSDASASATPQAAEPKKLEPFTETIPGSLVQFEMVPIQGRVAAPGPGGTSVEFPAKSYWIGKHEVTWDAFDIFVFRLDLSEKERTLEGRDAQSRPSKPYGAPDRGFGHAGYPALGMTYHSAQMYCQWLSEKTGKKYRLPTELEWQYAAVADVEQTPPALGPEALAKVAWFWDNAEDKTHPVGKKEPNAWGLHDMLGNVAEWVRGRDGTPVAMGGSYDDDAKDVTIGSRKLPKPEWNATDPQNPKSKWWLSDAPFIGFRVVCEE